jgi:hypothetical protein
MSIFDIFTEMHLQMTADMIADHEKLVREVAERMGLDPDQAWAEAQTPKVEMTCPACGQPATMTLMCRGCGGGAFSDYEDDELNQARQHLLDLPIGTPEARQHAAAHAYNPGGCMVCPGCLEQTLVNSDVCPLLWIVSPHTAIFYLANVDQDVKDELQRVAHLWVNVLADGAVRAWRHHLFNEAIPNALQTWKRWREGFIDQHRREDPDSPIR